MMHFLRLALAIAGGFLLPSLALAWCDDCESGQCCTCPGEPQCLGSHASCDEACGLVPPKTNCPPGSVANSAGTHCIPDGSMDCGGGRYCKAGEQCGADGGCIKAGGVPCGEGKHCTAGLVCGSGNRCLRPGDIDCGNGTSCPAGEQCAAGGCIPAGTTVCGSGYCGPGKRCGSGNNCLQPGDTDCGGGRYCGAGFRCIQGSACVRK